MGELLKVISDSESACGGCKTTGHGKTLLDGRRNDRGSYGLEPKSRFKRRGVFSRT